MYSLEDLLNILPGDAARWIRTRYDALPTAVKVKVENALSSVTGPARYSLQVLMDAYRAAQGAFNGDPVRIAVVGPPGAGKSSLVEAFVGRTAGTPAARGTPCPDTGPFRVVEAPDRAGLLANRRREQALEAALDADVVLLVLDATQPRAEAPADFCREAQSRHKHVLAVLSKMDLVAEAEQARLASAVQASVGIEVVPVSIRRQESLVQLLETVLAREPRAVQVVPLLLPSIQRAVAWSRVRKASAVAAAIVAEPIPMADVFPLTLLQAAMVSDLGRIYGRSGGIRQAGEVAGAIAGGVLLRTAFSQLARVVPGVGGLVASAYAAAGTAAVGYIAIRWFESGATITSVQLRREYRHAFREMLEHVKRGRLPELPPPASRSRTPQ